MIRNSLTINAIFRADLGADIVFGSTEALEEVRTDFCGDYILEPGRYLVQFKGISSHYANEVRLVAPTQRLLYSGVTLTSAVHEQCQAGCALTAILDTQRRLILHRESHIADVLCFKEGEL